MRPTPFLKGHRRRARRCKKLMSLTTGDNHRDYTWLASCWTQTRTIIYFWQLEPIGVNHAQPWEIRWYN